MKANGPRAERETIVNFNETVDYALIWTASRGIYSKFRKLGYALTRDGERSAEFQVPLRCIAFRSAQSRTLSAEQRQSLQKGRLNFKSPGRIQGSSS